LGEGPSSPIASNWQAGLGKHKGRQALKSNRLQVLPGLRPGDDDGRLVVFPRLVLGRLQSARVAKLPLETGGFLIGMRRGSHSEITDATHQGMDDFATPHSFERADVSHERAIDGAWRATDHRVSVVGDWHSHPYGDGSPSGMDRRAWRTLCDAGDADCVGVILGGTLLPRVFLERRKVTFGRVVECSLMSDEADDLVFGLR
jgi:integrative and conjugative element protein (TIGR02256 family)